MLHRIRDRLIAERTGTINAIRGHMAEFGLVAAQRDAGLKVLITIISDGDDARLPTLARQLLVLQVQHLRQVEAQIAALDGRLVDGLEGKRFVVRSCPRGASLLTSLISSPRRLPMSRLRP
jgi:transposase